MSVSLSPDTLDTLFPFSLIVDDEWIVYDIGRSIQKVLPALTRHHSVLTELTLHSHPERPASPADLSSELLIFSHPSKPSIRFRGQAVPLEAPEGHFILALDPTLFDTKQIGAMGLELSDFRVGDPIFDIALFTQSQKRAKERLESAKKKLEWESVAWKTILDITLCTLKTEAPLDAYRIAIETVCTFLDWDIGHLFTIEPYPPYKLISQNVWAFKNESRFAAFRYATDSTVLQTGIGLPGKAVEQRNVVWSQDVVHDSGFIRRGALSDIPQLTGVAVPIIVDGTLTAVLEFFSERSSQNKDSMIHFLQLLNIQLGQVIARQEAAAREKAQLAALAQSTKMAALGEIAAGVAHEINNPLHTLSLINELLKRFGSRGSLTPEILDEQFLKIDTCIKHMSRIVMQLRDFSRDTTTDDCTTVSLSSIVRQTLDLCQARIVNKRVRLDIPAIPETILVRCHPSELAQVILNLLNNAYDAVEHLDDRWIALDIIDHGQSVELSITDSGHGLPERVAQKIMTPFFTTKPAGKGTGLGLSISRNIVTGLGGDIFLDTSCPHTRFTVRLPQAPREAPHFDIAI